MILIYGSSILDGVLVGGGSGGVEVETIDKTVAARLVLHSETGRVGGAAGGR